MHQWFPCKNNIDLSLMGFEWSVPIELKHKHVPTYSKNISCCTNLCISKLSLYPWWGYELTISHNCVTHCKVWAQCAAWQSTRVWVPNSNIKYFYLLQNDSMHQWFPCKNNIDLFSMGFEWSVAIELKHKHVPMYSKNISCCTDLCISQLSVYPWWGYELAISHKCVTHCKVSEQCATWQSTRVCVSDSKKHCSHLLWDDPMHQWFPCKNNIDLSLIGFE